jgi:hypothetical protein
MLLLGVVAALLLLFSHVVHLGFAVLSDSCIVGGEVHFLYLLSVSLGCVEQYCKVSSPGLL